MGPEQRTSLGPSGFVSSIRSSARRLASNISPSYPPPSLTEATEERPASATGAASLNTRRSSTSSISRPPPPSLYKSRTGSSSVTSVTPVPVIERKPVPTQIERNNQPSGNLVGRRSLTASSIDGPAQSPKVPATPTVGPPNMATMTLPGAPQYNLVKTPSSSQSSVAFGQGGSDAIIPVPSLPPPSGNLLQNPNTVYQQIYDVSSKRISTLDYLRKAHDGRVYWFNTLLFNKADLSRMPFFEPKKLARRASNYLFLGLSLPAVLDLNASNPADYLRALNALLTEFESYQQLHPPDGSSASSLSRARIPQMFKRATHASGKGRRASSAADIGLPMSGSDPSELKAMASASGTTVSTSSSIPTSDQELAPGEEYTYLLTPSLPFDPDFFETFATLCDVLIDCYSKIMTLIPAPHAIGPGVSENFSKADAKLRKVMVSGVIKEFEEASRGGAKAEFAGVGKVVLGGLM